MTKIKKKYPQPNNSNQTAKNALVHGCYAKDDVVLPWESQDEFDELHRQCREDLNPHGALQEEDVREVTQLYWLKRRWVRNYSRRFICDPLAEDLTRAAEQGADGIEAYLRERVVGSSDKPKHGKMFKELSALLMKVAADEAVQKAVHDEKVARELAASDGGTQTFEKAHAAALRELEEQTDRAMSAALERVETQERVEARMIGSSKPAVDRLIEQTERVRASQVILDRLDRPEDFDAFLKRKGSIDAQIDKGIAKVARLKEYARLYGPKAVDEDGSAET
jgi:hypothetical protein